MENAPNPQNSVSSAPIDLAKAAQAKILNKTVHKTAGIALVLSGCLAIICFFGLLATGTIYYAKNLNTIALVFLVGFEISCMLGIIFMIIRRNIYLPWRGYEGTLLQPNPQLELLLEKITQDIQRYQNASYNYLRRVQRYKLSTALLAGTSTILLGLHLDGAKGEWLYETYPTFVKNAALVIGTLITLYSSLMVFWNIEKYWLINKTIANKLQSLKDDLENADKAMKVTPDFMKERVDEYKKIKGDFYKYWEGALSDRGNQAEQLNK